MRILSLFTSKGFSAKPEPLEETAWSMLGRTSPAPSEPSDSKQTSLVERISKFYQSTNMISFLRNSLFSLKSESAETTWDGLQRDTPLIYESFASQQTNLTQRVAKFIKSYLLEIILWPIGTMTFYFSVFYGKNHGNTQRLEILESVGVGIIPSLALGILRQLKRRCWLNS